MRQEIKRAKQGVAESFAPTRKSATAFVGQRIGLGLALGLLMWLLLRALLKNEEQQPSEPAAEVKAVADQEPANERVPKRSFVKDWLPFIRFSLPLIQAAFTFLNAYFSAGKVETLTNNEAQAESLKAGRN